MRSGAYLTLYGYMAILNSVMARTTIKSTYSLDVETVEALESMARRLEITKSEALRRAIRSAASSVLEAPGREIAALEELQRSLGLSRKEAQAWAQESPFWPGYRPHRRLRCHHVPFRFLVQQRTGDDRAGRR